MEYYENGNSSGFIVKEGQILFYEIVGSYGDVRYSVSVEDHYNYMTSILLYLDQFQEYFKDLRDWKIEEII